MATPEDELPQPVADERLAPAEGQSTLADEQPSPVVEEQPVPADSQPTNAAEHHSDTDSSSDGDESDAEQEPAPAAVEWLATGREKRSTAGNRLKHMLAAQEPDDELELLFAEDGDDAAFSEADEDGSDLHMDSSSDEEDAQGNGGGGGGDDDLEGEKELERKARENRQATRKRKAQEAIPLKFRKKKVKIATQSSPSVTPRSSAAANRPGAAAALAPRLKKKSERTSWLPTAAEMPTRASRRETTMMSKEQLHHQMIEREVKRIKQVEAMERKAKKMEALRKPPKTQAERLAEAAVIEKRNAKSLNRWEEAEKQREEERRAKLAALNNRTLDGPVVTFWSGVGEWVDGKLKYVGKVVTIEERPPKKKKGTEPDGEDTPPGTSEDVMMTEVAATEKAQAEESALMVKPATETDVSQTASDGAAAPTKLSELPATSTQDADAQQEIPAGAAHESPMDMPCTATTNAESFTTQQPQQPAPSEPEPQQAVVETDGPPSSTPNLPISGSSDTKPVSLPVIEIADSKRPEAFVTNECHEAKPATPQTTGDTQASSTLISDPPDPLDQNTAMPGTEATKINTAIVMAPELEINSLSLEAPHLQKPEDVDMQGVGDTVPAVAAVETPQLVSDPTSQHPDLQTSSIDTPGLAAHAEGTYTTMGFAPPSQLASMNPPDLSSHSPSFLARPVGINPGGLSIPQIGHFPAPGMLPSGLTTPQEDVDHQPPSLVTQVSLAPAPMDIAARPVGQGGQPIIPSPTPGAVPNSIPMTSVPTTAPLVAPKPVKPRGGRQKKEQDKEAETPPPPRTPPPDGKATRNCFIFQNFNENAIKEKSVQTRILFGKEMNKLAKPTAAPRCVITGQPARYKDPKTGLPYYNSFAYKEIQKLQKGEYKFSRLLGTWMGTGSGAATGVPARFLDPSAPAPPKAVPAELDQIQTPQRNADEVGSGNVGVPTGTVVPSMQVPTPMSAPFATMGAARSDRTQAPSVTPVQQPTASPTPAVQIAMPPVQSSTPALGGHREGHPTPAPTSIPAPDLCTAHEPHIKSELASQPVSTTDQTPQLLPTSTTVVAPITPQDAAPQP